MTDARGLYLELLRAILSGFEPEGLRLEVFWAPAEDGGATSLSGASMLGIARLRYRTEACFYRFPLPTGRGTLLLHGLEWSPTWKVLASPDAPLPASLKVLPAELARVRNELHRLLTPQRSAGSRPRGGRSTPRAIALELEARLNVHTFAHLHRLDQTNPLAELSDGRKIIIPGGAQDDWEWRAVRDVDRDRLCPLETPEGDQIGLRRFLARGARFVREGDAAGLGTPDPGRRIHPDTRAEFLGFSASLVPFLQHSDGVRGMMGAKNWKQALPAERPETPLIKTGWERRIAELSGRIIRASARGVVRAVRSAGAAEGANGLSSATDVVVATEDGREVSHTLEAEHPTASGTVAGHRVCVRPDDVVAEGAVLAEWPGIADGELALGVNALVGYMPFFGYTFEDGIVVSESFARRLTSRHLYTFTLSLDRGERLTASASSTESHGLVDPGIIPPGRPVGAGALLARKVRDDGGTTDLRYGKPFPGTVVRAAVSPDEAVVWTQALRALEVGDKITGRHGNKGVVSLILPDTDMPFFELDGAVRRVEVILSPMGVISRMNLGQLLETHYSWLARSGRAESTIGNPFQPVRLGDLRAGLDAAGVPEGKAEVFIRRGDETQSLGRIVVGYQSLAKLNHLARDKFHVRTGGAGERYSIVTDQPVKGRRLGGGQRLGEMEVWALLGHGAKSLLEEMLTAKSDDVLGRKVLELAFQPRAAFPVSQASPGFPETLRALRAYLRGLALDLEFLDREGVEPDRVDKVAHVALGAAGDEDIRRWSRGEVRKLEDLREPAIFGGTHEEQRTAMGHIVLPLELPHPLLAPLEVPHPAPDIAGAGGANKRAGTAPESETASFLTRWRDGYAKWKSEGAPHAVGCLPVIPWAFRHDPEEGRSHLNRLYAEVIVRASELGARLRRADTTLENRVEMPEIALPLYRLYRAVRRLFLTGRSSPRVYSLLQHLDGKFGVLRRGLLGKRQDFSGRAVIVPDPELPLDECGLPLAMAAELLRPALISRFELHGRPRAEAAGLVERAVAADGTERREVRAALVDLLHEHGLLVLLNRQPTLHRHNILAFRPRIRDDYVIGVPPLVCAGFNADFDGDTMAVYLPLTEAGQREAARLVPSRNAFKVATREPVLHLGHDFALGARLLSLHPSGRAILADILGGPVSRDLDKPALTALVAALLLGRRPNAAGALARLQAATFRAASAGAASFGIFDVQALALEDDERRHLADALAALPTLGEVASGAIASGDDDEAARQRSASEAESRLKQIEQAVERRLAERRDNPLTRYVRSGARGDLAQLRQLVGLVGYVFDARGPVDRLINGSFLAGIDPDDYYTLSHGARRTLLDKKLGVALAGALTRDLVEGAYELRVTTADCQTADGIAISAEVLGGHFETVRGGLRGRVPAGEHRPFEDGAAPAGRSPVRIRSPLTCAAPGGICRACYGLDPATGEWPLDGAMIGVLAAQSLGERGTQLSMQTFHAGAQALPIGEIRRLFARGVVSEGPGRSGRRLGDIYALTGAQGVFDAVMPLITRTYGKAVAPVHVEVLLRAMLPADTPSAPASLEPLSAQAVRAALRGDTGVTGLPQRARDWRRRGILAVLSYRCDARLLREIAGSEGVADSLASPKAQVMLASWRQRRQDVARHAGTQRSGA